MSDLSADRRRADARRSSSAVLDAAIELLGRRPEASMEEIAAAAGVVRQTVYAHYPSRRALLDAVTQRLTGEVAVALSAVDVDTGPAAAALRAWVEQGWRLLARYPVLLTPAIAAGGPGDEYERHLPIM